MSREVSKPKRTNKGYANVTKQFKLDSVLKDITGLEVASRGQVVKMVWKYIKDNNLKSSTDGRIIFPDKKLARLLGSEGKPFEAFTMSHFIESHLIPIPETPGLSNRATTWCGDIIAWAKPVTLSLFIFLVTYYCVDPFVVCFW
jgi:chromatin remodeling complex protein RSC6